MARLPTRKQAKAMARGMMDHAEPHREAGADVPEMDDDAPRMGGGRIPGVATGAPLRAPGKTTPGGKRAPGRKRGT